jgi:ribosomal protein L3 glutamine methyltransferase
MANRIISRKNLESLSDILAYGEKLFIESNLFFGHGTTNAWDDAVYLSLFALGLPHDSSVSLLDRIPSEDERSRIFSLFDKRLETKIPSAYITKTAWFFDLPFFVDERVIIPRSPIANLIHQSFEPWVTNPNTILDLCAGSGCIGISCAYVFKSANVVLSDVSKGAIEVGEINIKKHDMAGRVEILESDLFENLTNSTFDLIVSNPPYVDKQDLLSMPPEYHYEPKISLMAGDDGLSFVLRILSDARDFLTEKGVLIVEVGNSRSALESMFPSIPFFWFEFSEGDAGVFMLTRDDLDAYSELLG